MQTHNRLKIAIQKSGHLAEESISLMMKCGLDFDLRKDRIFHECKDFPIDLMLADNDNIPEYVSRGVCELGIVGDTIVQEKFKSNPNKNPNAIQTVMKMGFGSSRLVLAVPESMNFSSLSDLNGLKIATAYPSCLRRFLVQNHKESEIVELSGSIETAPALKVADAICDLVSTGATLRSNGLKEVATLLESQAVLIRTAKSLPATLASDFERLIQRLNGVIQASQSKYIMMNAPKEALHRIRAILPGMEEPSVMPLGLSGNRIAIHAVARETVFWETIENLKAAGANSILVVPIEKIIA